MIDILDMCVCVCVQVDAWVDYMQRLIPPEKLIYNMNAINE